MVTVSTQEVTEKVSATHLLSTPCHLLSPHMQDKHYFHFMGKTMKVVLFKVTQL